MTNSPYDAVDRAVLRHRQENARKPVTDIAVALFDRSGSEATVEFDYLGYRVRVSGVGDVSLTDADV